MDPLICVHQFQDAQQIELVGLIASCLSYGRVEQIISSIDTILKIVDNDLHSFITKTDIIEKRRAFLGFKHRFNTGNDISLLLESLKYIFTNYGTIQNLFYKSVHEGENNIKNALIHFTSEIKKHAQKINRGRSKSFEYLLPSPLSGSACKRLNMYLRWMVRENDGIDFGIFNKIAPSLLVIPVDAHIAKIAQQMHLCTRKSPDWKMAEEITETLRSVDAKDPVKFDFSLCRYGMKKIRNQFTTKSGRLII